LADILGQYNLDYLEKTICKKEDTTDFATMFKKKTALFIEYPQDHFSSGRNCFDSLTIPIFKTIKCSDDIAYANLPVIKNNLYRIIEIILLISFILIQIFLIKERKDLSKLGDSYLQTQKILFFFIIISLFDIIFSLIYSVFPILNFICRSFIIIFLIRNLRLAWFNIIQILWRTKTIFFLLFLNIFFFGIIGYLIFHEEESSEFKTVFDSMYQLYILLSTCNFPDIMLGTFSVSKWGIFYFIIYITFNFFILLSLLKTLYYYKYFDIYKKNCENIIQNIKKDDDFVKISKEKEFSEYLLNIKERFTLDNIQYSMIILCLGINEHKFFKEEIIIKNKIKNYMKNDPVFKYYLNKNVELIINLINTIFIYFEFTLWKYNYFIIICQLLWSLFLLIEFVFFLHYLGFKKMIQGSFIRLIFHFFNFLSLVSLSSILYYKITGKVEEYFISCDYSTIFICFKTIRILIYLNTFKEYKIIFKTLHNMRTLFKRNILNLFSLFLIFSTVSMIITGGNIKKNCFDKDDTIPNNYYHINFNDFGSSFLACLALMMINNLNIIAKSLSFPGKNIMILNFYFATFYFFSTLILLNIVQTLLLEMYLSTKPKKKIKKLK
jgi:hypothetical protein